MTAPEHEPWGSSLIGLRVRVTLQQDPVETQSGRLLAIDAEGECSIEDDHGVTHQCWPALDIEQLHATCPIPYEGTHWRPEPCQRAAGHAPHFHCDRYGRTW